MFGNYYNKSKLHLHRSSEQAKFATSTQITVPSGTLAPNFQILNTHVTNLSSLLHRYMYTVNYLYTYDIHIYVYITFCNCKKYQMGVNSLMKTHLAYVHV
jgi:hypothetical protein